MAKPKAVFISSTFEDLSDYWQAAREACLVLNMHPLRAGFAVDAKDPIAAALRHVDEADVYVGIFAHRYGYIPPGHEHSLVELEYRRARERGLPTLIFIMDDNVPVAPKDIERGPGATKLEALKHQLRDTHVVGFFKSSADLQEQIIRGLAPLAVRQRARSCFLAIPATEEFHAVRDVIAQTLRNRDITVLGLGDSDADLQYSTMEAIERADMVIADVTDARPDILFEAGIAVGMRKPIILLGRHDRSRIPPDLSDLRVLLYRPDEADKLEYFLNQWLEASPGSIPVA
jgi:hypothetical protein